jgi:elongator complex protein 2
VDKTVKIWRTKQSSASDFECVQTLVDHQNSINCISVDPGKDIFATGSADATVKIWRLDASISNASLVQSLTLKPRFFPLALALSPLNTSPGSYILAVAGTTTIVQLYIADAASNCSLDFKLKATLTGHEGWIRSLAFTPESDSADSDLLLSSASQDKYIRLWRVHQGKELPTAAAAGSDPASGAFLPGKSLSNKAHRFVAGGKDYTATFEALLLGHDDWIYSTVWKHRDGKLQLLSASADNSLSIWEQDLASSIWVSVARLGEISSTKGSTTATGSTGGFWTGLWSPDGQTVTCLGRTGSWRVWHYNAEQDQWNPTLGVGGHTRAVTGIAWSKKGDYLLSTSSDQTTRLHARWKRADKATWHEMARPQIHGYDLNCIDSLGDSQFVSGADEKLLRVFNEPRAVASLLLQLCGIEANIQDMRDAANMPVLGLSNKAIDAVDDNQEIERPNENDRDALDPGSVMHKSTLAIDHPPLEDHLSRNTLWPEIEKLYGHGYEISALATSHDGSVIATACKASSIDHAVIRLFGTKDWVEVKPPLTAHSLTVTRLRFSYDDKYLLSVGRDRQWAIFERAGAHGEKSLTYQLKESNLKGHSRMILDAAWAPNSNDVFATAGRDKQVKLWRKEALNKGAAGFALVTTIPEETPVTSIDFMDRGFPKNNAYLAIGTEAGKIIVYSINLTSLEVTGKHSLEPRYVPQPTLK